MLVDYVRYYQDAATGIEEVTSTEQPNMKTIFTDKISIDFPTVFSCKKSITLIDINGKIIVNATTDDSNFEINGSFLNKGMYLVKIETGGKVFTRKVIKN